MFFITMSIRFRIGTMSPEVAFCDLREESPPDGLGIHGKQFLYEVWKTDKEKFGQGILLKWLCGIAGFLYTESLEDIVVIRVKECPRNQQSSEMLRREPLGFMCLDIVKHFLLQQSSYGYYRIIHPRWRIGGGIWKTQVPYLLQKLAKELQKVHMIRHFVTPGNASVNQGKVLDGVDSCDVLALDVRFPNLFLPYPDELLGYLFFSFL
jgi:hypothetical protein